MKSVDCGQELDQAGRTVVKLLGGRLEARRGLRPFPAPASSTGWSSVREGGPNPEGLSPALGQDPESPAVRPDDVSASPQVDTLMYRG